jgi:hypothetical protein
MAWAIDTAQDGTLYFDQVNRSSSLLRFSLQGGHAVELARVPVMDSLLNCGAPGRTRGLGTTDRRPLRIGDR